MANARHNGAADTAQQPSKGSDAAERARPLYKRPRFMLVIGVGLVAATAGITWYVVHAARYIDTDDAFIDAHVTHVAPEIAGTVARVYVTDNQEVQEGQPLLELDVTDRELALQRAQAHEASAEAERAQAKAALPSAEARVAEARANVREAEADSHLAQTSFQRTHKLSRRGAVSDEELDRAAARRRSSEAALQSARQRLANAAAAKTEAQSNVQVAEANVREAKVAVASAERDVGYTRVRARVSGRVTQKSVAVGDVLQKGQQVMDLVEPGVWITANYKETELTDMRPGQPVSIEVDAYPDAEWKGRVDSIQKGTGARFSLLPAENATGNYVKVVQRVPVKIVFEHPPSPKRYLLAPGMSVVPVVDVTVDTHRAMNARYSSAPEARR